LSSSIPVTPPSQRATASGERHLRADAQRNREAILAAAESEFRSRGADASIDGIAERAGVGVGTVYRNYATKDALMRAILAAHVEPMLVAARESLQDSDPGAAFLALVRRISSESCSFKALSETLAGAGFDFNAAKQETTGELMALMRQLFRRGQEAGALRDDVTVQDFSALMQGLSHTANVCDQMQVSRCVDLICDALSPLHAAGGAAESPAATARGDVIG
jgi:AcrR family transcriptional regulator